MSNLQIQRYDQEAQARAQQFLTDADSKHDSLKVQAAKAANERDYWKLWELTESYILTHGKKRTRTSRHTMKAYRIAIKKLVKEFWTDVNLLRPTKNNVLSLINKLETRYAVGSQRIHLSAYKMLYKMLRYSEASKAIPFTDIVIQTDTEDASLKRDAYTTDEVTQLLRVADREQSLVIVLAAWCGLRNAEIVRLQWKHVNTEPKTDEQSNNRQEVTVLGGKGGKSARVPIITGVPLDTLSKYKNPNGFVIESIQKLKTESRKADAIRGIVKTVCILAKVEYKGAHSFRHHIGTWLADNEYTADQIKDFMRHASASTSEQIYIKGKRIDMFKDVKVY